MRPLTRLLYESAARLATAASSLARGDGKLARSLAARHGVLDRWSRWAVTHRDPSRALIWFHAPSVGEGLQARPVIEALRAQHPEWQLAYSYFSPSASGFASRLPVDVTDFLPFDTTAAAAHMLSALRPSMLVFSKLDVWPILCEHAQRHGVPTALISATMSPVARRHGHMAQALLRDAYSSLAFVGAIAADDAARLEGLGCRPSAVAITGDTRFDQVWARAGAVHRDGPLLAGLSSTRPTLVAGSTWPADEAVLLPAWERLRAEVPQARLIIAPHEPTPAHLAPIERWATDAGLRLSRLGDDSAGATDVVLVDRVGVLGELYALAHVAFVGGGFHDAGLHSVLEPAAFGAPVLFGPRHDNSREASALENAGGGSAVSNVSELGSQVAMWFTDAPARATAGSAARDFVSQGLGATRRTVERLEALLPNA